MSDDFRELCIKEIQRIGIRDGGIPPGMKKFENEVGIKEYEWQRVWPRWGDALIEAGFTPNSWIRQVDEEELLSKLCSLVKQLGRFPTQREIKIASRQGEMPSEMVYRRRYGSLAGARTALAEWTPEDPEFEEIHQLLESEDRRPAIDKKPRVPSRQVSTARATTKLLKDLSSWAPKARRRTEGEYRIELRSHLESIGYPVREEKGESLIDLRVGPGLLIELKKAPDLGEYDRLLGQVFRHIRASSNRSVIVVIFDVERQDQFDDFKAMVVPLFKKLDYWIEVVQK